MVTVDSSCTELGIQKHYGPNSIYTRGVAFKLYFLILMNKGVLKKPCIVNTKGAHSYVLQEQKHFLV